MNSDPSPAPKSKWRVHAIVLLGVVNFMAFMIHMLIDRTSAFPSGGRFVDGQFLVSSHGHDVAFTVGRYWFSYIHGIIFVIVHLAVMLFGMLSHRKKAVA